MMYCLFIAAIRESPSSVGARRHKQHKNDVILSAQMTATLYNNKKDQISNKKNKLGNKKQKYLHRTNLTNLQFAVQIAQNVCIHDFVKRNSISIAVLIVFASRLRG